MLKCHTPVVSLVLAFLFSVTAHGQESAPELERAMAVLEELETASVSVNFHELPLAAAIDELSTMLPVQVVADWSELDMLGVSPRQDITLRIEHGTGTTVLSALAYQLGDQFERSVFEIHADRVHLTTREATVPMRMTGVYDLRDLLAHPGVLEQIEAELAPADPVEDVEPESDDASEAPDDGAAAAPPRPRTPGESMIMLIVEHVDPDAWINFGGDLAMISERGGVAIVTAPPTLHRTVRDTLRRLRRAWPSSVELTAAVVDVPRTELDRLSRRHNRTSATLGRMVLAARGAQVVWEGTSTVALDHEMHSHAENDGSEVEFQCSPSLDGTSGQLMFQIEARARVGDQESSLQTDVVIPFRDGGAVLDLADVSPGEMVRLLVILPKRL